MQKLPTIAVLILPLSLAFGQVDSNSITVTSSRNATSSTPDQALYSVHVSSDLTTGLDDVVNVAQQPTLDWWFTFTAPFAKTKDTIATLAGLQANIAKNSPTMTMSFSIQGTQSSVQPTVCSLADLLTDARTQAQKMADGAGVAVGSILAMSSPTSSGSFSCTLTVKFGLLRY